MNSERLTIIPNLAKTTTQKIVDYYKILMSSHDNITVDNITDELVTIFSNAYKNIESQEEYKQLNTMLLLKFHPDKISLIFDQTFHESLEIANKTALLNIPIQLLVSNHERFNDRKTFNNFMQHSNSSTKTQSTPREFSEDMKEYEELMKQFNERKQRDQARIAKFKQQFDALTIDEFSDLPTILEEGGIPVYFYLFMLNTFIKINKVSEDYPNSWRYLGRVFKLGADGIQFGMNIVYVTIFCLLIFIPTMITLLEDRLFKALFGKEYKDASDRNKSSRNYWMMDVITDESNVGSSNFGMINFITKPLSLLLSTPIILIATLQSALLLDLKWLSKKFYLTLSTSLPETKINMAKAVLTKLAQLILGAVLFVIFAPIELIKYALFAVTHLVTTIGLSLSIATHGVTALPGILGQYFNTKQNLPSANQSNPKNTDSDMPRSAQTSNTKANPVHHASPIHTKIYPDTNKEHHLSNHNDQAFS